MIIEIKHHSALPGLGLDTHQQYLRTDGSRPLAGPWNLGGKNLTNGGTISAVNGTFSGTVQTKKLNITALNQAYLFTGRGDALLVEGQAGMQALFELTPLRPASDPTDGSNFTAFRVFKQLDRAVNKFSLMDFASDTNGNFVIRSQASGAGIDLAPIVIETGSNAGQLVLNIDGTITASGGGVGEGTAGFTLTSGDMIIPDGVVKAAQGEVGAPSYSFAAFPATGMYWGDGDDLRFATTGVRRLALDGLEAAFTVPVRVPLGVVGAPSHSFFGDRDTGMWSSGADIINFSTHGIERLEINDTEAIFDVDVKLGGDLTVADNLLLGTTVEAIRKLTVAQDADSDGIRIYGFDDHSADFIDMNLDSFGTFILDAPISAILKGDGASILRWDSTSLRIFDDIVVNFGNGDDSKLLYKSSDDTTRFYDNSAGQNESSGITMTNVNAFGFGTAIPAAKLHVVGSARFGGQTTDYTQIDVVGSITQSGLAVATLLQLQVTNNVGFYGTTPVTQNQLATGGTIDQIITELQRLGLVRQAA